MKLRIADRDTPRPPKKTPCKTCPFKKSSLRGYLGAYQSAGEFLRVHYTLEVVNPCHETMNYDQEDWKERFMVGDMGRACRGQAEFFANSLKLPRGSDILKVAKNREVVFSWPHEFLAHHGFEDS